MRTQYRNPVGSVLSRIGFLSIHSFDLNFQFQSVEAFFLLAISLFCSCLFVCLLACLLLLALI
jgi:hypothetical protein